MQPGDERPTHHDECYACPIGGFFLTARAANPETFEHLLNVAAEMVAAARSALEAAERVIEAQRQGGGARPEGRVQRVDIEGSSPPDAGGAPA